MGWKLGQDSLSPPLSLKEFIDSTAAGAARCRKYPSKIPFPVKAVAPEF
jgi:hypothetical protein